MKKVTWVICILFAGFFTGKTVLGQVPSRDKFNFIFENNFENDQLGRYVHSEYIADWNLGSATTLAPHEIIDIISDSDARYGKAMRAYFPEGTVGASEHGAYWETPIAGCTEIYFSYDVRFKPGFDWVIGGKIPGVYGGKTAPGKMPGPTDGFSTRVMWKENGRPVAYVYHQNQTTLYGNSYYWGNFAFTTGKWYNVTIRVVLNTVGSANGIYEGYIDGKLMFQKKDFEYRGVETVKIEKMNISMFFGGSTIDWAPTRDEWIDTDNFVAYTYSSKATNVPRGIQACAAGWTLLHPYYNFGSTSVSIPGTPTSLTSSSAATNSVSIRWNDNSSNEQGFKIECRKDSETAYSEIASVATNATTFTHSGLQSGSLYHYRVRAYNTAGNSAYSNILDVSTAQTIPAAPGTLQANLSGSAVNVTWVCNATNESGFRLERSTASGSGYSIIHTGPVNCVSYTDNSILSGTIYYYRVRSYNSAGESANSNIATITVPVLEPGGLIARYVYENSVADITANGHNGTTVNGAAYSTSRIKEGYRSLSLDGTNDYVNIGTFNFGNAFTIASWVYIPSGSSNIQTIIANTSSGSTSNGFKIVVNTYGTTDRSIRVETGNGTVSGITTSNINLFEFDKWNHIAVTFDRTNGKARIYYNGTDVTASTVVAPSFAVNSATRIGMMTNTSFPMKGNLDDTRVYNRILASTEIMNLTRLPYLKSAETIATGVAISMDSRNSPVVFPNPFTEHFTIRSEETIRSVEIYDLSGARIFQQEGIESSEYLINSLQGKSVYVVKIILNNGTIHNLKVLKN